MLLSDLRQLKSYMKVRCLIKITRLARQSMGNLENYYCVSHFMVWKLFLFACLILCFMFFGDCKLRKSNKLCYLLVGFFTLCFYFPTKMLLLNAHFFH